VFLVLLRSRFKEIVRPDIFAGRQGVKI